MEVGPLARMLVGYAVGPEGHQGDRQRAARAGSTCRPPRSSRPSAGSAPACMETVLVARQMQIWYGQLVGRIKDGDVRTFNGDKWEPETWPKKAQGYGYLDAPRGALGHWVQIENGKISRYQCVVPSTWNCSPRDEQGRAGPLRGGADGPPSAAPARAAAGNPADHPLLRSLHVLRRPRARRRGPAGGGGQGPMTAPRRATARAAATGRFAALPPRARASRRPRGDYRWVSPWGWPAPLHALGGGLRDPGPDRDRVLHRTPYFLTMGGPPQYLMGYIRLAHFVAAGAPRHDRASSGSTGSSRATSSSGSRRSSRSACATGRTCSSRSSTT